MRVLKLPLWITAAQTLGLALIVLPLGCNNSGTIEEAANDGDIVAEDGGDEGNEGNCTPGAFGCPCLEGVCGPGLMCENDRCELAGECTPGALLCQCNDGACDGGLECTSGQCMYPQSPSPNCGWDPEVQWNVCGSSIENPAVPVSCGDLVLESGTKCPEGLTVAGCCDELGNNWWCEVGTTAVESCDESGDGDGEPGDGDGDGDDEPGDGDGEPGDGDGDDEPGDGDGEPGDGDGDLGDGDGDLGDGDGDPGDGDGDLGDGDGDPGDGDGDLEDEAP